MQAIAPVTTANLLAKGQQPLLKFEIYDCCCWVDLTPYVIANSLAISTAGAEMTPDPVAGSWSVSLFNKNGRFDPDVDTYAPDNEYLRAGRKVKISIGAKYGGVDYYWRRIYGFMEIPDFSIDNCEVTIRGFDNMQFLTDTKLRMPNNYWGSTQTFSTGNPAGTLGGEIYAENDAMEIDPAYPPRANEADTVAQWTVRVDCTFASIAATSAPPISDFEGQAITTDLEAHIENPNVGNATLGDEYKVTFWYKRFAGSALPMSVGIFQDIGGFDIKCGGKSWLTANVWTEETFYFTALKTGILIMKLIFQDTAQEFRIDNISIKKFTDMQHYRYELPVGATGVHYAELNEGDGFLPVWPGKQKGEGWYYDSEDRYFYFDKDKRVEQGVNNLIVHYYTQQIPENIVADLLVRAGLYDTRAEALAAMIYTITNITIDKVWFKEGEAAINGVRMLCERCNYRFYFNYGQRPVFKPAPAPISTCDVDDGTWTGTALSIDTVDKKEGIGSLVDTIAAPIFPPATNYNTMFNPAGTWDWSSKKHILFWLKCDRPSTAFTGAYLQIVDTLANWRYWWLNFSAGEWTAIKCLLSTGNAESGVPPNLALITDIRVRFVTADITPFYKKIDDLRVTDFDFTESQVTNIRDYEDRNEIRNRIVIEGIEQAAPEGEEETRPSKLKGEALEVASINKYGEHTWTITNHLFQDQTTIDTYCATYLAAFKDPKWYTTYETPFNPVPLVKGDTLTWRKQYEVGGTPINQRGIIRDVQIDEFIVYYKIEKVA